MTGVRYRALRACRFQPHPSPGSPGYRAGFFEGVIPDNLDGGRPDQVHRIFARRATRQTPGAFGTRVVTDGVVRSLHVDRTHRSPLHRSRTRPKKKLTRREQDSLSCDGRRTGRFRARLPILDLRRLRGWSRQ